MRVLMRSVLSFLTLKLVLFPNVSQAIQCFSNVNSTHLKEMPNEVKCECDESQNENSFSIETDILRELSFELVKSMSKITISDCQHLIVNVTLEEDILDKDKVELEIRNANNVEVSWESRGLFLRQIRTINVSNILTKFMHDNKGCPKEPLGISAFVHFYVNIALSALIVATWISFGVFCIFYRTGGRRSCSCCFRKRSSGKKVSRTESWLFERNFVNPSRGVQQFLEQSWRNREPCKTNKDFQEMCPSQFDPQPEGHAQQQRLMDGDEDRNGDCYVENENDQQSLNYNHKNIDDQKPETISNVNSASYSSRNQAETLPMPKGILK